MGKVRKTYITFDRIRLFLFIRSYSFYHITQYLKTKYKIDNQRTRTELRNEFFKRNSIPEISKLVKILNLNYKFLWKAIILDVNKPLSKSSLEKKIKIYLSIENELISLAITRNNKSYFKDSDYEEELALLGTAIERAAGNSLKRIKDDLIFSKQLEVLQRKYTYWYYRVAYKYKLPTIRIVPLY